MPNLKEDHQFGGRHWETGSVHNHWAYRRFKAPHTQQPYSEALLMGISGGIVMGYFSFAYEGYDPHVAILTRNTFDPLDTLLSRLGVEQIILQTTNPKKATQNLAESLAEGLPPLVWADQYTLSYNALPQDAGMWHMAPLVVFGYDEAEESVWLADRACVPLTTSAAEFHVARGRVKQDKYKLVILEMPDAEKLPAAVNAGIWSCIQLFTEMPPKGSRHNFGLAAYQRWADLLTNPKQRLSWAKEFAPGSKMIAGLTSAFTMIALFGQDGVAMDAERGCYADFLEEAAVILKRPKLPLVAEHFRQSAHAWRELAYALLPDAIPAFSQLRALLIRRHRAFLERGNSALAELHEIDRTIFAVKEVLATDFPLSEDEVSDFCHQLASKILEIRDIEQVAVEKLKGAM